MPTGKKKKRLINLNLFSEGELTAFPVKSKVSERIACVLTGFYQAYVAKKLLMK